MKSFCGWVPTITGNLSFAIIGQGRNPKRAFKVSRASKKRENDNVRYVVAAQKRRTTDTPFWQLGDVLNRLLGRVGWSVYILFGKSHRSEEFMSLTGPCIELTPVEFSKVRSELVKLGQENLSDTEFDELFESLARKFSHIADHKGCDISAVELARDGKITINLDDSLDDEEAQSNASQVFFFVRDICHVHQHHAPTSDTILDVVPYSGDDGTWKRETLYALFRWVIQQKRSRRPSAYIDAKGVLAYAHAFTEKHCKSSSEKEKLPEYLRGATLASLEAGLEKAQKQKESEGTFSSAVFNRIVPLLGVALAFLTPLYSAPGSLVGASNQQIMVASFARWLNDNIISAAAGVALAILLVNVSVIFRARIFGKPIWYDFFRVLFPVPYYVLAPTLFLLAASLLVFAVQEFLLLVSPTYDPGP